VLIERLETVPYALPFREPYVTARGRLESRELLLVRLHTSGGPVGLGEAAPLALRGGPGLAEIDRELCEACAPLLEGRKLTLATLSGLIAAVDVAGVSRQALAGIDLALHDLLARIEGEPVWRLLGAADVAPVRCNATLVAGEPDAVAADAAGWAERGFDTFKLKVGVPGDRAAVAGVRKAVGEGARIRVDANGAWPVADAVEALDAMATHNLELAEQPAGELADLGRVRRAVRVPIAADESVVTAEDAERAVTLGACDLATVKLAKVGGIAPSLAIADQIPAYLSSALDGPVGIAAAAHLAQALPRPGLAAGLAQGLATQELFAATIAATGPELDGPDMVLPDEPGLGVELDELALARHRL
jgi:o-succinylbenzoate synthase